MRIFYGWYVVAATFVAISLGLGLAYFNNPVFYPAYIGEFHWSRTVVVSGGSVNFVVFGMMSPFIGVLADRFSVKKFILAGIICDALSKISWCSMPWVGCSVLFWSGICLISAGAIRWLSFL